MPKVLIIDDAPEIRKLGALAMSASGYEVRTASGGQEGFALALADPPDVILLDVQMGDLDGPATLKMLVENPLTRSIPVIFLTASADHGDKQKWIGLGARGVLGKPFRPRALAHDVAVILAR